MPEAVEVLALIATKGKRESSRIAAAAKVLDIARLGEKGATAKLGKKALADGAALESGGDDEWGDDLLPPDFRRPN